MREDYGKWPVGRLKEELRLRGAAVFGKKKDLVERLVAYDKYGLDDTDRNDTTEEDAIPWTKENLDHITSSFACPPVTVDSMYEFLGRGSDGFNIHPGALQMYKEGWIISALAKTQKEKTYLQFLVCAQMKKTVRYHVRLVVDKLGDILHAHCECTAGAGSEAKCKHVCVALFGLESLARNGTLVLERTCTQHPQAWHVPKRNTKNSSPTKAANITYKLHKLAAPEPAVPDVSQKTHNQVSTASVCRDDGEQDRLLNLIKNYQAVQPQRLNISDVIGARADVSALADDHNYCKKHLLECYADNMVRVTADEADAIEMATRGQSASSRWYRERRTRLTASNFGAVMNMRSGTNPSALAERLVNPPFINTAAVVWGREREGHAIRAYERLAGSKVQRKGFVVDLAEPFLGCSPDGVTDDRVVEVKCLYAARHSKVTAGVVDWLVLRDGHVKLKEHSKHWYQVQGQMAILDKDMCDLVVYSEVDLAIVTVFSVPGLYREVMVPKFKEFFTRHMVPVLCSRRVQCSGK